MWKWDLQLMWSEALPSCLSFLSPCKDFAAQIAWKKIFTKAILIKASDIHLENNVKYLEVSTWNVYMFILERYYTSQVYNVFKLNAKLHHVQPSCHQNTGTQKRRNLWRDIATVNKRFWLQPILQKMNILEMV